MHDPRPTAPSLRRSWLERFRHTPIGRVGKAALDRLRRHRIERSLEHLHGPRRPELAPDDLIVFCIVRDGELHVRSFLEHHLGQGARWVLLVDNGSVDRTLELARRFEGVVLWRSPLPMRPYEWLLRQYLVETFARDRWSLTVDIDERFDYPGSARLPLRGLLAYLEHEGYTAVVTYMLDRFARGPVGSHSSTPDDDPATIFTLYDLSHVARHPYHRYSPPEWGNRLADPDLQWLRNGIRHQAFGAEVSLTKQALVFCGRGTLPRPANHVRHASIADVTAVLYHYKFLSDFRPYVEMILRENVFPPEALQYRRMLRTIDAEPTIDLATPSARELHSVEDLVADGFLSVSPRFRQWLETYSASSVAR